MTPRQRARFEREREEDRFLTREQKTELMRLARVACDEPMAKHTTFGVGGPAEALVDVNTMSELKNVMAFANEQGVSYLFLGAGSNVLVRDGGIRGMVLRLGGEFKKIDIVSQSAVEACVAAGAAVPMPHLVRWAVEQGFCGLEVMAGVPGVVGGNIIMNAGTRAGVIGDLVEEVTIVDRQLREMTLTKKSLRFEYRRLKLPRTVALTRAVINLTRAESGRPIVKLGELLQKRRDTQPVAEQSCGCVFKNPEKVSAGQLIDDAGLKGVRVGGARISTLHANFIVNEGKATAHDILVLIGLIKDRVKQHSGVQLETEVVIVGEH